MTDQTTVKVLADSYYRDNFSKIISFVNTNYSSLLTENEDNFVSIYESQLSGDAQCLLVRLLSRRGPYFLLDQLDYKEIEGLPTAAEELIGFGLASGKITDPVLFAEGLTKDLLIDFLSSYQEDLGLLDVKASWSKALLLRQINALDSVLLLRAFNAHFEVLELSCHPEYELVKLLYFGNLHQDLHEFILEELDVLKYEKYEIKPDNLFFAERKVVDDYLRLSSVSDLLWNYKETKEFEFARIAFEVLMSPYEWHERLASKLVKLRADLGYIMERLGDIDAAIALYELSDSEYAKERTIRILAKGNETEVALELLEELKDQARGYDAQVFCQKFGEQLKRKLGLPYEKVKRSSFNETVISLESGEERVEELTQRHFLEKGYTGFYSENVMFNALTGLFFWDVIFSPMEGAFFHPFQRGPVDLFKVNFAVDRVDLLKGQLEAFDSHEQLKAYLLKKYSEKEGVANWMVHWKSLTLERVKLVIDALTLHQIKSIVERMILNLREHRSGLPDLILFTPEGQIVLAEVKGPGDQLRNNQRSWLSFFDELEITWKIIRVVFEG